MNKWLIGFFAVILAMVPEWSRADEAPAAPKGPAKVVVIPVKGEISKPQLFILRRGLKEAIDNGVETIVLDMHTRGGSGDVTFEMLKALEKFPGKTVTYVNEEAMSAGALISAGTDDIYFAPGAVIGAAAPVSGDGTEINETMRAKLVSYLKARVRAMTQGKGYRGEVISAMIDLKSELKIGDEVIKEKDGDLLSLTAQEAMKEYGDPPMPLLGAGIADNLDALLDRVHGKGNWSVTRLEVTWSEKVAQYITSITPILMAIGLVLLFIEFKTPGLSVFGIAGGVILATVFLGQSIAGLSGHEPLLFFALGVALVLVEIFFFPGTIAFALSGIALMLGSLVWSMVDFWPDQPLTFSAELFMGPLVSVAIGVVLAIIIFLLILRFVPKNPVWGRMILQSAVGGEPGPLQPLVVGDNGGATFQSLVGQIGVAATALMPSGQVDVGGRRFEARVSVGFVEAGAPIVVTRHGEFSLEVEVIRA